MKWAYTIKNKTKAALLLAVVMISLAVLYAALDASALYTPHAQAGSRSLMNVTWTLGGAPEAEREALTARFVKEATAAGLDGLKGHRSVGGLRASIYNAFPEEGVKVLCEFMREFERKA